jgi:hypothetical protein
VVGTEGRPGVAGDEAEDGDDLAVERVRHPDGEVRRGVSGGTLRVLDPQQDGSVAGRLTVAGDGDAGIGGVDQVGEVHRWLVFLAEAGPPGCRPPRAAATSR